MEEDALVPKQKSKNSAECEYSASEMSILNISLFKYTIDKYADDDPPTCLYFTDKAILSGAQHRAAARL